MPESAFVDDVRQVARKVPQAKGKRVKPEDTGIRVRFASGVAARLNPSNPRDTVWAEVLESLRDSRQPAYVEIDPETHYITSLLLPLKFNVTAIRDAARGDLEIELEISHARHYLRRDHPRFDEIHRILERALREKTRVLVTESLDSSAIIDVRPAPSGRARGRN